MEPVRFPGGKGTHIPASWPVFGEYDSGGGIKGQDLDCDCALIHRVIWDNAHIYWHKENRPYEKGWLNIEAALKKTADEKRYRSLIPDYNTEWGETDYLFYGLKEQFNKTDFGLVFRDIIEGKESVGAGVHKKYCFIERGKFMEHILNLILANKWTNKEQKILDKIICLYSGQMMFGRAIAPSNSIYVEQYPEYKQRIEILKMNLELTKKLSRDLKK